MAINVDEADLAQPGELELNIKELVRGILGLDGTAKGMKKALVQGCVRRSYVLQIQEDCAGLEQTVNLREERELTLVRQMMNGKAGDHSVECSQRG